MGQNLALSEDFEQSQKQLGVYLQGMIAAQQVLEDVRNAPNANSGMIKAAEEEVKKATEQYEKY